MGIFKCYLGWVCGSVRYGGWIFQQECWRLVSPWVDLLVVHIFVIEGEVVLYAWFHQCMSVGILFSFRMCARISSVLDNRMLVYKFVISHEAHVQLWGMRFSFMSCTSSILILMHVDLLEALLICVGYYVHAPFYGVFHSLLIQWVGVL